MIENKKKILIRIGSLREGGAEKTLSTFLKNIPRDKYDIDLLLNLNFGIYLSEIPSWINIKHINQGEIITTNRIQDIPIKAYRKIYQGILKMFPSFLYKYILKNKKYDIEIIANHDLLEEMLKSPQKNSKKIVWIHTDIINNPKYKESFINNLFKTDRIWVISEKIKQDLLKAADEKDRLKIAKITNPIDENEIIGKSQEIIEDQAFSSFISNHSLPIFISIGTIYPVKGFDRLIKVHKRLINEGFNHKLIIIGEGRDFKKLKNEAGTALNNTLLFTGFKKNPYPYLKKADYYVLPSRNEGFPTVLVEALILNKAIVATNVSGVEDILSGGKFGLIVDNSEEGIYEGMKKFLKNFKISDFPFSINNSTINLKNSVDNLINEIDLL